MKFRTIKEIGDIQGKVVILRLELNVPIADGAIVEPFRLEQSLPTINFLREKGAKILIIGHIENEETKSLILPFEYFLNGANLPITFAADLDIAKEQLEKTKNGGLVMLENLRKWPGEKENDMEFARKIAELGDLYVNEAFSVSHRNHASIVSIPKLIKGYAGILFEKEVESLSKVFNPKRPFLFILGGAKVETKMPLLIKFMDLADNVTVGGAIANDFLFAKGYEVGKSLLSNNGTDLSGILNNRKFLLPVDIVAVKNGIRRNTKINDVKNDEMILDMGNETVAKVGELVKSAGTVLWNGPLGLYEDGFVEGSEELARIIAESNAESIIGGGDTLAVINKLGISDKFTFISTAGGAMLDFLANETLPGIEVLK